MMNGWYPRRRGILEHLERGDVSLLDIAVHDVLSLWADHKTGVCWASAEKIKALCPADFSYKSIMRSLSKLERIGWLKRWMIRGKKGNYPILVCRYFVHQRPGSVHDASMTWWKTSGERTTDWRDVQFDPVHDASFNRPGGVREVAHDPGGEVAHEVAYDPVAEVSGNQEGRSENSEFKNLETEKASSSAPSDRDTQGHTPDDDDPPSSKKPNAKTEHRLLIGQRKAKAKFLKKYTEYTAEQVEAELRLIALRADKARTEIASPTAFFLASLEAAALLAEEGFRVPIAALPPEAVAPRPNSSTEPREVYDSFPAELIRNHLRKIVVSLSSLSNGNGEVAMDALVFLASMVEAETFELEPLEAKLTELEGRLALSLWERLDETTRNSIDAETTRSLARYRKKLTVENLASLESLSRCKRVFEHFRVRRFSLIDCEKP
jgi:hypothetical protein